MTAFTLVRHGEVHADWQGRLYGAMDVPLSEYGQSQARAVARELEREAFEVVISSGLARAEFTAAALRASRPGLRRVDRPTLVERSRGDWAGWSTDEIDAAVPGGTRIWRESRGAFTPPGGETMAEVADRVVAELSTWCRDGGPQRVAVVAHLWVLRAAVAHVLNMDPEDAVRLDIPMSGRVQIRWPEPGVGQPGELVGMWPGPTVLDGDRA